MKIQSNKGYVILAAAGVLISTFAVLLADQTDEKIVESAQSSFVFRTFLKKDSVKAESKDGSVTLTGAVEHEFQKTLAADTVSNIPEVKSVDNRLTVKGDHSSANADQNLVEKVKTMLLLHRNLSIGKTAVDADKGKITLRGKTSSRAQKELITEYVKDIDGVTSVANDMLFAKEDAEPKRTIAEKIDDASITAQIKASLLLHRSTSALKTHIQTRDGVVIVSGIAANAAEKNLVKKLIMDIDGVTKVENNISYP